MNGTVLLALLGAGAFIAMLCFMGWLLVLCEDKPENREFPLAAPIAGAIIAFVLGSMFVAAAAA